MLTITSGMHDPAHPGEILSELYMKPLGVTINQAAEAMKVSRKHVSSIVNGRAAVTADMARRLAVAFSTEAEIWLSLQAQFDLAHTKTQKGIRSLVVRKGAGRRRVVSKARKAA